MSDILPDAIIVDVSHWQPPDTVDWNAARTEGNVVGVVAKLTQGDVADPAAIDHLYNAYTAGITLLGVYDFGTASDDAQTFITDALAEFGGDVKTRLIALDLERNPSNQMTVPKAEVWVQKIHDRLGRWPTLYMGKAGPDGTGHGLPSPTLASCDLWLPAYGNHENNLAAILPPGFKLPTSDTDRGGCLRMWQFTGDGINSPGPCPGLGDKVDRSYAIGFSSLAALTAWWGG